MPRSQEASLGLTVLQVQPQERHLVLLVRESKWKDRFLCGHDEREWFVAAVRGNATTVAQAREALKPEVIRVAEVREGVRPRERQRRRNAASIRQGEWFFIPQPGMTVKPSEIVYREPIRRERGKPHVVAELYRTGGVTVHTCPEHPNVFTEEAYRSLLARHPEAKQWAWSVIRRNVSVYARGTVRHPDHATITLPCWHQVLMNTENSTGQMGNVAFLD